LRSSSLVDPNCTSCQNQMIFTLLAIYCTPTKHRITRKKFKNTQPIVSKKPIARQKYRVPIHRKKSFSIFLSPAGISLTKLSLGGNNLYTMSLFQPKESLVSDIPAGDRNIEKLFCGVETAVYKASSKLYLIRDFGRSGNRKWDRIKGYKSF
jgi:hypothetical protein